MIELFIVLVVILMAIGLCLHHHTLKKKLHRTNEEDSELIREAAQRSIAASNSVNPVVALVDASRAVQIIEGLHLRYGPDQASEFTETDTRDMLRVLNKQKEKIMQQILRENPRLAPVHPLSEHAGFVPRPGSHKPRPRL